MRSVIIFSVVALAAALVVPRYVTQTSASHPAPNLMAAHPAPAAPPPAAVPDMSASRSVTIPPNPQGHFEVEGRIDGRRLTFMVDTGASMIALTADTADNLGIHPAGHDFTTMIRTANGVIKAAPVQLDMVEIDDIMVHDVAALVLPDGALSENLLGLSFLSRLRSYGYSEGKFVLEQ
jgi:aspartyl protease family protein